MDYSTFRDRTEQIVAAVSQVIIGKDQEIRLVLAAFLAGGHVLLEDVPGLGKTMLVKTFSKVMDLPFKRIQFTPDLLPSDLTGIHFYDQKAEEFVFRPGPLFANLVLADEINRATPRTQSALLEAMEEKQITVDGVTKQLSLPFMVLATQNPIETFGTFPLPEAQLDRFMIRLSLGYPEKDEERRIVEADREDPLSKVEPVLTIEDIDQLMTLAPQVNIKPEVMDYLLDISRLTRQDDNIQTGVSPRGSIALAKMARVMAAMAGRDYVLPEDVKLLAPYVFNHRVISRNRHGVASAQALIADIISQVKVPLEA
ncbi:MAG TPA: MoxR family ATPase [Tissierellia bacterium]|nr:MoxR family ATPase [Tissierellia bacterium]